MDIAKRVLQLCDLYRISPNKLANLADMPPSTIQDIVNGKNQSPQVKTIEKICEGFGITLSDFFAEDIIDEPELPLEAQRMLKTFERFLRTEYQINNPGQK